MISGTFENTPVRRISGAVEVVEPSTANKNLVDMTKVTLNGSGATLLETSANYVLAQGKAGTTPGSCAWSTGYLQFSLSETAQNGKTYTFSYDIEYLEQVAEFDLPVNMGVIFANTVATTVGSLTAMGTYHIERTYTLTRDVTYFQIYLQSCKAKVSNLIICEGSSIQKNTIYTNSDSLVDIKIDRVGANKFFGFGISQKATITLLDKERQINFTKNSKVKALFDGVSISPTFKIDEAKRDEKTNKLVITAYDVINDAAAHTMGEFGNNSYTVAQLATAIAEALGVSAVIPALDAFSLIYEGGANFEGTETFREALNAIAELTQTIYFVNHLNQLEFKRLDKSGSAVLDITKANYMELQSGDIAALATITSATELGDNITASARVERNGVEQTFYNNPFLELREDAHAILLKQVTEVGGTTAQAYKLNWRGNYLLQPCDKITIQAKDGSTITSYLITDTLTYNGGLKQASEWAFSNDAAANTNPASLGEVLKQTFARVDKANKEIELVASEASAAKSEIASIRMDTDSISASVSSMQTIADSQAEELAQLTTKVNATLTSEEMKIEIQKQLEEGGTSQVVTSKGFAFNDNGLEISSDASEITTTITEDGMRIEDNGNDVLTATSEGVTAIDLKATTFLVIGTNSRFENYGRNRTACFWIGG